MPHKHKRKRGDESGFNLPPSTIARSLPTTKASVQKNGKVRDAAKLRGHSDTPKAFTRLMNFRNNKKFPQSLDDGPLPAKKRKREEDASDTEQPTRPTIRPGERLADFAARVDQALPIAGLNKKGKRQAGIPSGRQTKMEKKLQRLQKHMKEEEQKRKEAEQEARELQEDEDAENDSWKLTQPVQTGKRGKTKETNDDPWAALKNSRPRPGGLHDVAQAPPEFERTPKQKFKIQNGAKAEVAEVPNAAGSLKRREELGTERNNIIQAYRLLAEAKRYKADES